MITPTLRRELSSLNTRVHSLQWRVLAPHPERQSSYRRSTDEQRHHSARRNEKGESTCVW